MEMEERRVSHPKALFRAKTEITNASGEVWLSQ